jgi:hypothetical protein
MALSVDPDAEKELEAFCDDPNTADDAGRLILQTDTFEDGPPPNVPPDRTASSQVSADRYVLHAWRLIAVVGARGKDCRLLYVGRYASRNDEVIALRTAAFRVKSWR